MDHVDSIEDRVQALLGSNEANFSSWMLLITEIEDTWRDEMQKICLVYDSFLSEFPLCFGYWIRYAGHMARLCTLNEVEEVYERAVKAASYSVHLWVSYCSFVMLSFEDPADVRRLFERGLSYVAKDYFCDLIWDKFIEFEYSQKNWSRLAHIYINTLSFPSRRLLNYYESFKKLVALLEEYMGFQNATSTPLVAIADYEMPYVKGFGYAEISSVVDLLSQSLAGPEVLKKFLSIGELLYHHSRELDGSIRCFEVHIKRHYFHMKPLDEFQLENWHKYLTFVEEHGNFEWTIKLYERCLIPCANYTEFWIRYVNFVDANGGREIANDALERALKVFLKRIPAFLQYYSMFKEKIGEAVTVCVPFLQSGEESAIDVIENVCRKANMEKRMGNIEAAQEIYDKAIRVAHEKQNLKILSLLYISLARFIFVVTGSVDTTKEVFIKGVQHNPSKSIIEGFLDFMTMHGGTNHVDSVGYMIASLLSPESEISHDLSSQDREGISQLYLKFVDLYGTIHEVRKAWERHMKLFPHIMRPSTFSDSPSKEFRDLNKRTEGSKSVPTGSPNYSSENPGKTVYVKYLVESPALMNTTISLPEDVLKCEQKTYGKTDNWKERRDSIEAEAISSQKQSIPEMSEIGILNKFSNESPNVAQIPDASSEYHETEIPLQSYVKEEAHGNIEPPMDNLSIANTVTSHGNSTPQEVTSKKDGNKPEGDSEVSLMHSKNLSCESSSQAEPLEDGNFVLPSCHADRKVTKTDLQPNLQERIDANQALLVNTEHPKTASDGGQWAQVYHGVQDIADPNFVLHGCIQPFRPQHWQAHGHMHNQTGGTNLQLTQTYVSQTSSLLNSQDPQANHSQLQHQLDASQAYVNPSCGFLGQHMQQPAILYSQEQQLQQASSQNQIQPYQSVSQCDGQYGYYQNVPYPPHIWQYYQSLYELQQQQMQQRQHGQQVNFSSPNQQWADPCQERSSQQEMLENQEEKSKLQIQPDIQEHKDVDNKQNATKQQQSQQEKLEESTQPNPQNSQMMDSELSQLLYLQQQQQFYLQQQQHHQMYLQKHHLLQQQQHQQQQLHQHQQHQQHQQLLVFQQQQLLHFQNQQQVPVPPSHQE